MHYTITDEFVADMYLKKLIDAQKRGVKVFLIIDDLMSNPNEQLLEELKRNDAFILKNKKTKYFKIPFLYNK